MILGQTTHRDADPATESLVLQLMMQQRYAEAYGLLQDGQPADIVVLYNSALCLHWSGNYQEALNRLEKIQLSSPADHRAPLDSDQHYREIRARQNQIKDYLQGISSLYVKSFPTLVREAVIRLKTDCWLKLGDYPKVIAVAKPFAHKKYQDITDALTVANTNHDPSI